VNNDAIYNSKKELLNFLGIKENFLYNNFSLKYTMTEVPKKSGGFRTISAPNKKLKDTQRKILDKILSKIPLLDCVYGLSQKKNIKNNALAHKGNVSACLLNLDIENFFPNVKRRSILNIFLNTGFVKENSSILTKICTMDGSLPQGAPTSPYLASLVCLKMDKEIYKKCKNKSLVYTRYFDDISISGKNITQEIQNAIKKIIEKNSFKCKESKTFLFEYNDNKMINNILITNNGLSVTNKYKDEILRLYNNFKSDKSLTNERRFRGKFGFYLHINKREAIEFIKKYR
jgi:retron-type reverse transcriptase